MRTSGLILDVYDDFRGDTIRSLFPSRDAIPELVKEAQALTGVERDLLPDDAFALVLLNGEEKLRKYACIDAGGTALSVMYFLEHGSKLPLEAQKTAAANLEVACGWYDLPVSGLEKVALLGWAARTAVEHPWLALNTAMTAPHVVHDVKENQKAITEIQQGEGWSPVLGSRPISPDEVHEHRMMKGGEVSGTSLAPISQGSGPDAPAKAPSANKTAHMSPYVDVHDLEAKGDVTEKKASRYALAGKYPLDSYAQVKAASAYFDEFGRRFAPAERREFCLHLLERAEELNIKVAEQVRHYGATELAPYDNLKIARDLRVAVLEDEKHLDMLLSLFEKSAELHPDVFVETLVEFDKLAGIDFLYDKDVPDPYYSLFYKEAAAEFSFVDGNDYITEEDLRRLSKVGTKAIKHTFGEDFMVEFQSDPVGIFKSLPHDQKRMIMHMANDNSAPGIALLA